MCTLYTVGYEGTDIQTFVNSLEDNGIRLLIDVREIPLSRKPGFSKRQLKDLLQEHNIRYIHLPQLGSPKDIRKKLYSDGDYESFFQQYRIHANEELDSIIQLLNIVEDTAGCLLCFEHNPQKCHRSILAELMNSYSQTIDEVVDIII